MVLSSYRDYGWTSNYEPNVPHTGLEIKNLSLIPESPDLAGALRDIGRLWQDSRDEPHTNLYYSFFRLALTGMETYDTGEMIRRGGLLNLLFFAISFIFFSLLMSYLFPESRPIQCLAVFCAFMSTAAISNTLFFRPYQLQETFFIIFAYYVIRSFDYRLPLWKILPLALLTGLTLLTGYYALVFVCLFGLWIFYANIRSKTYLNIVPYVAVLALGLLFAWLLYRSYFTGFFSYRATETADTVVGRTGNTVTSLFQAIWNVHYYFYSILSIAACGASIIYLRIQEERFFRYKLGPEEGQGPLVLTRPALLLILSVLFTAIIMILAPYRLLRYVMPAYPFFIFLPAALIRSLWFENQNRIFAILASAALCFGFIYPALDEAKIQNLYRGKAERFVFTEEPDTPVVILNQAMWKYSDMIPYLHDQQTYYVNESFDDILPLMLRYDQVFLVSEFNEAYFGLDIEPFERTGDWAWARFFIIRKLQKMESPE